MVVKLVPLFAHGIGSNIISETPPPSHLHKARCLGMMVTRYSRETYCNHCPPPSSHQWFHLPATAGGNLVDCTASSRSPSAGALWRQRHKKTRVLRHHWLYTNDNVSFKGTFQSTGVNLTACDNSGKKWDTVTDESVVSWLRWKQGRSRGRNKRGMLQRTRDFFKLLLHETRKLVTAVSLLTCFYKVPTQIL